MSNCGACDLGLPHEHTGYHPATFLYGAATAPDSAKYWYEAAMESAKEANKLRAELDHYKKSKLHRLIERLRDKS